MSVEKKIQRQALNRTVRGCLRCGSASKKLDEPRRRLWGSSLFASFVNSSRHARVPSHCDPAARVNTHTLTASIPAQRRERLRRQPRTSALLRRQRIAARCPLAVTLRGENLNSKSLCAGVFRVSDFQLCVGCYTRTKVASRGLRGGVAFLVII